MRCLAIAVACLFLTACGRTPPTPDDIAELRTYGWETTSAEPQAEWNPATYQVLLRAAGGFAVLDEGGGRQDYFTVLDKRDMQHADWLSRTQFVFGPKEPVITTKDGRIVASSDGLTVATVGVGSQGDVRQLCRVGWRPRRWRDRIVAGVEDRIVIVDSGGTMEEFTRGFFPEPQRDGPGICYQETPVIQPDHWTAKPVRSDLVIRWRPGVISKLPGAIEARWTASGGVVAVVLVADPPRSGPWWTVGTKLVFLAGPKAVPRELAVNIHCPDPHPKHPLVACTDAEGHLVVVSLDDAPARVLAEIGERPRWSADGLRLLAEEPMLSTTGGDQRYLRIRVLSFSR